MNPSGTTPPDERRSGPTPALVLLWTGLRGLRAQFRERLPLLVGPLNHVLTADAAATDSGTLPKARLREELPQHPTQSPLVDLKCRRDAGETEHERRPAADVIRKSVGEFDSVYDGQVPCRGHVRR
jgi:hypothetical protein